MIGRQGGCELWRTLLPVRELQRQGYEGIGWLLWENKAAYRAASIVDAVVLERRGWPKEMKQQEDSFFNNLHRVGKAVIYETDDDVFTDNWIERNCFVWGYSEEQSKEMAESNIRAMRKCDGVTVSTQRVATIARNYTDKPVKVVGNYMDFHWWKTVQKRAQRNPKLTGVTIGWAGGRRPDDDIEPMVKAWGKIAEKYPKVTFIVQGHSSDIFCKYVPEERVVFTRWMPIDIYPAGLLNIDIGCCPLEDTQFNHAKSFIKAMEYAASNAAVVASPTVYNKLIEHGVDGYIANTPDEWEQYLSMLVEDYTLRHEIAKRLLAKVRKQYNLETNAWRWAQAWTEIVNDFRERSRRPHILLPKGVNYYAGA